MNQLKNSFVVMCLVPMIAMASELPKGFERPGLIEDLRAGKVVIDTPVSTPTELIQVVKAFFKRVNPDHFINLATNHEKYGLMFKDGNPRINKGTTLSANDQKNYFEYAIVIESDGPFGSVFVVDATGKQAVLRSALESKIENELTSHKDKFVKAAQDTRIIPFEGGLLVEDRVQLILKTPSSSSAALKKQLGVLFSRFPDAFRKELGADPN